LSAHAVYLRKGITEIYPFVFQEIFDFGYSVSKLFHMQTISGPPFCQFPDSCWFSVWKKDERGSFIVSGLSIANWNEQIPLIQIHAIFQPEIVSRSSRQGHKNEAAHFGEEIGLSLAFSFLFLACKKEVLPR